jgi:hypothetical protein
VPVVSIGLVIADGCAHAAHKTPRISADWKVLLFI